MGRLTGWELEAALDRIGTTTREVADASGIPEPDIARYLTDESLPFGHAAQIERALWRIEAEKLLAEAGLAPCPELAGLVRERYRDPDAIDVHIATCAVCQERAALVQDRLGRSPSWLTTTLDAVFGGLGDAPRLLVPILTGMIVVAAVVTIPLGIVLVSSVFTGKLDTLVPLFLLSAVALVGGAGAGLVWTVTPSLQRAGPPGRYLRAILTMWGFFACVALAIYLWPPVTASPLGALLASRAALVLAPILGAIAGGAMATGMRSPPRLPEEPVIHTRGAVALYAVGIAVVVLAGVSVREYALRHTLYARPLVSEPSSAANDSAPPATASAPAAAAAPSAATQDSRSPASLGGVTRDPDVTHGVGLVRVGKFRDAEPYFRRAFARDSNDPQVVGLLAFDLTAQGRRDEGLGIVRAAADRRRASPAFQEMAANFALGSHDFATAYTYGHRAVALDSTDALPWAIVAHAAFGTNRMTESDSDYQRVARLDPSFFTRMPFEAQIRDEVDKLVQEK
ncbi:MAG TPA: hypothetical protein VJ992_06155 [Gemmatimonadales bacterium]|nr:hypothetical protein [Gemmatimonadales bacterium]